MERSSLDIRDSALVTGISLKRAAGAMPPFIMDWAGRNQSHSAFDAKQRLFRGAQMAGEAPLATPAQRPVIIGAGGIVGMTDQIGHRRVAQHASAVGQCRPT